MSIDPLLLNVKPISEITTVDNPTEGYLLFYDGSDELKKVDISEFQSLIGGIAKPLAIADATPTTAGWYKPTTSGTYANAGGLVAQVGYDTLFYFDGTTWSLIAVEIPNSVGLDEQIKEMLLSESYMPQSATYTDGIINSPFNIIWANGATGAMTVTRNADGLATNISATHIKDTVTKTVTSVITRNADGNATNITTSII